MWAASVLASTGACGGAATSDDPGPGDASPATSRAPDAAVTVAPARADAGATADVATALDAAGTVTDMPPARDLASVDGAAAADRGAADVDRGAADAAVSRPARVLLYHLNMLGLPSLPAQLTAFKAKLAEWKYEVDDSVDPLVFTDATLAGYAVVAMINTCFEPFGKGKPDRPAADALLRFVQAGGGLFGTHCASVTYQSAQPPSLYNQLLGGRGGGGSFDGVSDCRRTMVHPTSAGLPDSFRYTGNLDNTDYLAPDTQVLVRCKWSGANGKDVAVSWVRNQGAGRIFYTNFAKVDADLRDPVIGDHHIYAGLAWVLGR